jgi:ADP-heptose:LPS heptosyltransferase
VHSLKNYISDPLSTATGAANYVRALEAGARLKFAGEELPELILAFGIAPGDDLLCTVVFRELRQRNRRPAWFLSGHPELFEGKNDVDKILPLKRNLQDFSSKIRRYRSFAKLWNLDFRQLAYQSYDPKEDRSESPRQHIIAELCSRAGVTGRITVRPYLVLTQSEKNDAAWVKGRIAIQSSGLAGAFPMRNKQWIPERYQAVVDGLRDKFEFVQLGSNSDPALENVTDLRGKTTIRQTAAILHHAQFYIGNVGLLMHLARAVECPSVIVYGGREAPWQSGYTCNINLYRDLSCAPCWRWNTCDFDHKCMTDISTDDVLHGAQQLLQRPRNPLKEDIVEVI